MRFSFRLAAVKGVRKIKKKKARSVADESEGNRKGRKATIVKPDSKPCGFDQIPEGVLMNILARLPAKRVTRAMCVSQLWYSVTSSAYFTKLFVESPSSEKPPRFIASRADKEDQRNYAFLTSTQDNHSDSSSVYVFDHILKMPGLGGYLVNALRGLICVRLGRSVQIYNLTTRQRVFLPTIRSSLLANSNDNIWTYFGYDPVYNEYKVITTVWEVCKEEGGRVVRSEHQVLVLGPEASWRHIQSMVPPPPHRPYSRGISINNMLYYGAWVDKDACVVMSFDLANEDYDVIELPVEAGIIWGRVGSNLMNYEGKLAISRLASDGSVKLWIMEDAKKRKWSNKTLVLPLHLLDMDLVDGDGDLLIMAGTDRPGEVSLTKRYHFPLEPEPYVLYDLEKNKITKSFKFFPMSCVLGNKGSETVVWKDDIENIMYLET